MYKLLKIAQNCPSSLFLSLICLLLASFTGTAFLAAQAPVSVTDSFTLDRDIHVTIDRPLLFKKNKKTIIIFYALPNGNTTEQTMGKQLQPGDDWHFDIQHIKAQTSFVRQELKNRNIIVVYLEAAEKSWPLWKRQHPEYKKTIPHLVDSLSASLNSRPATIYLIAHSGGGSFIFGYLDGVAVIPPKIKRISFLDSDYGYDSSYFPKISRWLKNVKASCLTVFAYNDSIVMYNGKPLVSATGGTWHRSHLFLADMRKDFYFQNKETDSLLIFTGRDKLIGFYFKKNLDAGIYHTQQVELNGFIHAVLFGTRKESRHYQYYGKRAYGSLIE